MTHKIDIGDVVAKVFDLYFRFAAVLLPVAAALFLIEAAFRLLGLGLVAGLVGLILSTLYAGMVVELVSDVRDGRLDQSPAGLARSVAPVLLPLIAVAILAGIGIAIGLVLLIVPGLFLATIWAVVAPVTVLERPGVFTAFGRSRSLVRGNGWQVFGVIVLFILIFIVIGAVLGVIGALLGDVGGVILNYAGSVITAPLLALASAVLYFELRQPAPEANVASE